MLATRERLAPMKWIVLIFLRGFNRCLWSKICLCLVCVLPLLSLVEIDKFAVAVRSRGNWAMASPSLQKKINFVAPYHRRTPNPVGWEAYDGSPYNTERGYGWETDLSGLGRDIGRDRGAKAPIALDDGTSTSPEGLGRLELANMQGWHQENLPFVFRLDLPNGWYRVTCTSVNPGRPLPLVDRRSFKCRAHDVVFAGADYGAPLVVGGNRLVEGAGVVEVTDGHLRVVVGDPAYPGWTWDYRGPWYRGWSAWLGKTHQYASGWYQKLMRIVDPGFHHVRLNSLEVERVVAPSNQAAVVFRDFFNRADHPDVNAGLAQAQHWDNVKLHPHLSHHIRAELYRTSIKLTGSQRTRNIIGLLQPTLSPGGGRVRYSMRVSVFTGEGSRVRSGVQEAGIVMLVEPSAPNEFNATFVGVAFDDSRLETRGWLRYRVGDGQSRYRTALEVADTVLPFKITEGEYEIVVEHDVKNNILSRIQVNGVDVTDYWPLKERRQRISQGRYGIRSAMDSNGSGVILRQFYWSYRVEQVQVEPLRH